MKKIVLGLIGLLAIVVLGIVLVGSNLDSIVKAAVEKYGTEATKSQTRLAKVELSLTEGKAKLEGFTLANPDDFSSGDAISFGKIEVEIDPKSVMGDGAIQIRRIIVEDPKVLYEVNKDGSSNLQVIQQNVAAFGTSVNKEMAETAAKTEDKKADKERTFVIEEMSLNGGNIQLKHALLKDGDSLTIPMPPIRISGLGNGDRGITPAMAAQRILEQIVTESMMAGRMELMHEIERRGLGLGKEAASEAIEKANEAVNDAAGEAAEKAGEAVGNAIGGLLGK
ncbi:MAG: hypothetical protein AB7S81_03530 [Bdellovibrionales bacterium]